MNMRVNYSKRALTSLAQVSPTIRKAFYKQLDFLKQNIQHPSLHAKKYNESGDVWQARVNRSWRFYFTIVDDTYQIEDVITHPK